MTNPALQLHDYHIWANKQIFSRLKELPKDVYRQEVESVFPSIAGVLAHVYLSDVGWIDVFSGKRLEDTLRSAEERKEEIMSKDIEEMEAMFLELSDRYKSFLQPDENINQPLVIEHPSGDVMKTSVSDMLLHVVNHGTYHRGNITAMLRQMGYASVPTDYGVYLYVKTKEE
ncbi:DinB family protein [Bacillus nakamurai]|uniref:Damage-inducible protein DinB n=1 Tax=Bacillus nakamurai TaxID=1793963 RepID=A0A150F2J7_9BACI|nr:DinB family protein [Bacillus nakamurai]KXZ13215.1 damage-inducible protein DinB [Bacillus nakamurai]MED1227747.1 DinB family protein [Bacillus nakamurai]